MGISLYPPLPKRSPFTLVDWDRDPQCHSDGDPRGSRGRPKSGDSQRPRFRWGRCHKASGASGACAEANSSEWRRGAGRSSDSEGGAGITALIVIKTFNTNKYLTTSQHLNIGMEANSSESDKLLFVGFHLDFTSMQPQEGRNHQKPIGLQTSSNPQITMPGKQMVFLRCDNPLYCWAFHSARSRERSGLHEYCNSSHGRCLPVVLRFCKEWG